MAFPSALQLPAESHFVGQSTQRQRRQVERALGRFVDCLQVEGRGPTRIETAWFRMALRAMEDGNFIEAYRNLKALQEDAPPRDGSSTGKAAEFVSYVDLAIALRGVLEGDGRMERER